MKQPVVVVVATVVGLIVGFAGGRLLDTAPAACVPPGDAAAAKADAVARRLHAHDRDAYVPHSTGPIGELPKPVKANPSAGGAH